MSAADEAMSRGVPVLLEVLAPHGFVWVPGKKGIGSGGYFVSGAFVCGDRELEIHYRYNLGGVTYRIGNHKIDHEAYMRAVLPQGTTSSYPGFSEEGSIGAFHHLASDLRDYCGTFLSGQLDDFRRETASAANAGRTRGYRSATNDGGNP
jgi:hypothetical protein